MPTRRVLAVLALIVALLSQVAPGPWPLLPLAVILLAIAMLL